MFRELPSFIYLFDFMKNWLCKKDTCKMPYIEPLHYEKAGDICKPC